MFYLVQVLLLLLDFYLGIEGLFVVVVMIEVVVVEISRNGFVVVWVNFVIVVVVIILFFILFGVGCEDMNSWVWLDVVVSLLLLCEGNFVLIVFVVGVLGFDVVVVDFYYGVYDWCLFVYWVNINGLLFGVVVVILVDILVYIYVYYVLVVVYGDCIVVEDM